MARHIAGLLLFTLSLGLALPSGCASTQQNVTGKPDDARWFAWLAVGGTTREEALLKFGLPAAQFENDRILTWRLAINETRGPVVIAREFVPEDPRLSLWKGAHYSLVLVFDEHGILKAHSLIRLDGAP